MHYKTRTYLNEAVILRSTGCDINEVWSMYATFSLSRVVYRPVICHVCDTGVFLSENFKNSKILKILIFRLRNVRETLEKRLM